MMISMSPVYKYEGQNIAAAKRDTRNNEDPIDDTNRWRQCGCNVWLFQTTKRSYINGSRDRVMRQSDGIGDENILDVNREISSSTNGH
ncbi:hypothetical protein AAZX31_07G144400 [Glycine max]